jgi:release factor glutamine methyltransferase
MSDRTWTLVEILNTAHHYLEEKGIEAPRRSAEMLLGKVLNLSRMDLYLQHDRPLKDNEVGAFRDFLRRRVKHEPLQYILGTVDFCGLALDVMPGLLIPRPETEEFVQHAAVIVRNFQQQNTVRVLDLGTGTGCIAVALAHQCAMCTVDAVDLDIEALHCTERNAARHGLEPRIHTILGDIFHPEFVKRLNPPYDLMVSNPPYVCDHDYAGLQPEVRNYEASRALLGGPDGLNFYRRMADLLPNLLRAGGALAVEIGLGQRDDIAAIFAPFFPTIHIHPDLADIPRVVTGAGYGGSHRNG